MASRCGLGGLPLLRDGFPKHPYPAVETKTWCKEKVFIGVRTSYTFLVSQVLGCLLIDNLESMEMFTSYHCPSFLLSSKCITYIFIHIL